MRVATKTYDLSGTLLEACSCRAPCPRWLGDAPDEGRCDAVIAYYIERGSIRGLDVSGLSIVEVGSIAGDVVAGRRRMVLYVDDRAAPEQRRAMLDVWSGSLGGPLADLARLVGERIAIYAAPIEHQLVGGVGTLRVGAVIYVETALYRDAAGRPTSLHDAILSTIPGSPALLARASPYRVRIPDHGLEWEFSGCSAMQGNFHFTV